MASSKRSLTGILHLDSIFDLADLNDNASLDNEAFLMEPTASYPEIFQLILSYETFSWKRLA